jgi:release factor glutamine methyltransferase
MQAPDVEAPWTVARLLAWTKDHLHKRGLESPRLCAEVLLAHAMGCERLQLFTRYEEVPKGAALDQFRAGVREAAAGRPIAYIVGRKDFFSLPFEVTPDVLIPRPETELLVERAIAWARGLGAGASPRILDVGCGSGCIAVALARNLPAAALGASDISEPALAVAKRNAERHGVSARIDFRLGDVLAPWREAADGMLPDDAKFDLIVSNPPYLRPDDTTTVAESVRKFEPAIALFGGADGLDVVRRLAAEAPALLRGDGRILIEIGLGQAESACAILREAGWTDVSTTRDGGGIERVVQGRIASQNRAASA